MCGENKKNICSIDRRLVHDYIELNVTQKHANFLTDVFICTDVNDMYDIAATYSFLAEKFYRNPLKYMILSAFEYYVNEYSEKYRISIEKKAISTHLTRWTGWRHDAWGNEQYCTRLYGGYVLCCVFKEKEGVQ